MDLIELTCPSCGPQRLEIDTFDHMIVVGRGRALATYVCPYCSLPMTTLIDTSSESLCDYIDGRLVKLTEEHPRTQFDRFCVQQKNRNEQKYISHFQGELEETFGVEDALKLSNTSCLDSYFGQSTDDSQEK